MSHPRRIANLSLAGLGLLLAGCLAWLLLGGGSAPGTLEGEHPPEPLAATNSLGVPGKVALPTLANTWQIPLFSAGRQPDAARAAATGGPGLDGLVLTGVVVVGDFRQALFKQPNGRDLVLRPGATLGNGWRVGSIEPTLVRFEQGVQTRELQLPRPRVPNMKIPAQDSSIIPGRAGLLPPAEKSQ